MGRMGSAVAGTTEEAQSRVVEEQGRGGQELQDNLSYSNWEEEEEGGHLFQDSGAARARVTFSTPQ